MASAPAPDPAIVEFVKALARANAARDIALDHRKAIPRGKPKEAVDHANGDIRPIF